MSTIARTRHASIATLRRTIIAAVLAAAAIAGLNTASASAAAATSGGPVGAVTYYQASSFTSQVFATGALYPTPTSALNVPGVTAYRGAFSGYQYVTQTVVVQKYVGGRWVNANTPWDQTRALGTTYSHAQFPPTQLSLGSGYYSVTIAVRWSNQYGQTVAATKLAYVHSSDYSCRTAGCWVGNGYIAM